MNPLAPVMALLGLGHSAGAGGPSLSLTASRRKRRKHTPEWYRKEKLRRRAARKVGRASKQKNRRT